ncbi:MAG: PilZ domain-containing protein [Thermodesulfovibrionales bacterium]|nr:PilZ domain-containing protein [Thermodesulfovibrionales bacterium]
MENETRGSERLGYACQVSFVTLGIPGSSRRACTVRGKTVNISNEGMCLRVKKGFIKVGSIIQVRMPVRTLKVTVPILSEIRWVKEEKSMDYTIGIRFIS